MGFQNAKRRFARRVGDQVNMILFAHYFSLGDSLTTLSIVPFSGDNTTYIGSVEKLYPCGRDSVSRVTKRQGRLFQLLIPVMHLIHVLYQTGCGNS